MRQAKLKLLFIWYNPINNVNDSDFLKIIVSCIQICPAWIDLLQVNINLIQNILKCSHEYSHNLHNQIFRFSYLQHLQDVGETQTIELHSLQQV